MRIQLDVRYVNSICQSLLLVEKVRTAIAPSLDLWSLHCRVGIFSCCSVCLDLKAPCLLPESQKSPSKI